MPDQLSVAVAREVGRLLAERGMSGRALAKASGIPYASCARKLAGTTPFDVDDLDAVCAVLGVKVSDLMDWAQRT